MTFNYDKVHIELKGRQKSVGGFQNNGVRGELFTYKVKDGNFPRPNIWEFGVFVPRTYRKGDYISVQPLALPSRQMWAGTDRRSLQVARATKNPHKSMSYVHLAIHDVTKMGNTIHLKDKDTVPAWVDEEFDYVPRSKVTVADNRADPLVVLVAGDDHRRMIKLFLALKPWVIKANFHPEYATGVDTHMVDRHYCLIGKFRGASRNMLEVKLEKKGAKVHRQVTDNTHVLAVGSDLRPPDTAKRRAAERLICRGAKIDIIDEATLLKRLNR